MSRISVLQFDLVWLFQKPAFTRSKLVALSCMRHSEKPTQDKYPKKTLAKQLVGSRIGLRQTQKLKHIRTLGIQTLTSNVFLRSTTGLRKLICVIISTCNYVVWSLVPFGCFDAFRKGSGFWRQRKMENNSFHLEMLLPLLIHTSLRTLESLTTLIPSHTKKPQE